jgi:hypothetical protein
MLTLRGGSAIDNVEGAITPDAVSVASFRS